MIQNLEEEIEYKKKNWKKLKRRKKRDLQATVSWWFTVGNMEDFQGGASIRIGREIQCLPYAGFF